LETKPALEPRRARELILDSQTGSHRAVRAVEAIVEQMTRRKPGLLQMLARTRRMTGRAATGAPAVRAEMSCLSTVGGHAQIDRR
jgi:hypothetical protein